ncbi:MAG: M6 family metalloprotease domain-containing protein [Myxococcales bacterium]|nr:MAG: M6 family metalloprotease domain-containing protein [Myxococcales bacterium]
MFDVKSKSRVIRTALACALLILLLTTVAQAAPIRNHPVTVTQPDGEELNLYVSGDEYRNWLHDAQGFVIKQHPKTGYYVYVNKLGGEIVETALRCGWDDPWSAGLLPGNTPNPEIAPDKFYERKSAASLTDSGDGPLRAPRTGSFTNLVVFIRFADEDEFTDDISTYESMFNAASGNSMYNYFKTVSYNQLDIASVFYPAAATHVVSYQDSHDRSYFQPYNAATNPEGYDTFYWTGAGREWQLIDDALTAVKPGIPSGIDFDADDDGFVDSVVFIISGATDGWSDLLWPHMWTLYDHTVTINGATVGKYNLQIHDHLLSSGVGVLAHEMFHTLGAPDLYHYVEDGINPVGFMDLMEANQNPPQHMGCYMKWKYGGWIGSIPEITEDGTYWLTPLSDGPNCYRFDSPTSTAGEFYVIELRKNNDIFDWPMAVNYGLGGLIVYRINPAYDGNAEGPPDEVYAYRVGGTTSANGNLQTTGFASDYPRTSFNSTTDPKPFLTNGSIDSLSITNISAFGDSMNFMISGVTCVPTCDGKECGSDGCGGSCGACEADESCNNGQCVDAYYCVDADLGTGIGQALASGSTLNGGDDTQPTCAAANGAPDRGFAWTTPADGNYIFDTAGSSLDTVLYALAGDCAGSELACNDDSIGLQSRIALYGLQLGQQVTLVVDGYGSAYGDFILNVSAVQGCEGYCNGQNPATGCWCDEACATAGDCCTDVCDWCSGLSHCCVPNCSGKECGDDGCGGICGTCDGELACTLAGQCVTAECLTDGDCPEGFYCDGFTLTCQPLSDGDIDGDADGDGECVPNCDGKQCGSDGCGGSCGECEDGLACNQNGQCIEGAECETDADCQLGFYCDGVTLTCQPFPDGDVDGETDGDGECAPNCDGKQCGPDGCGGSCGGCANGEACDENGQCVCEMMDGVTGWKNPDNGHCYWWFGWEPAATWLNSEAFCVNHGAHLVSFVSEGEMWTILDHFGLESACFYIGCTDQDQEGTFIWTSGESFDYNAWWGPEPNNGQGWFEEDWCNYSSCNTGVPGTWNDCDDTCGEVGGNQGLGYICESFSQGCILSCSNKECGDDGCGGSCGECNDSLVCDGNGQCVEGGEQCDPCVEGETPCADGYLCIIYTDLPDEPFCVALCDQGQECPTDSYCYEGWVCIPNITSGSCQGQDLYMDDACGHEAFSMRTCDDSNTCTTDACDAENIDCLFDPVEDGPSCDTGFGPDSGVCQGGACQCIPDCTGRECGSDRCGLISCGQCDEGEACSQGQCREEMFCVNGDLGSVLGLAAATGATVGMGDDTWPPCLGGGTAEDAAYAWRAPFAGVFTFDTFGSGYDTSLYVLEHDCGGQALACNDDYGNTQSQVTVQLEENQAVVVVVDGFSSSVGDYVLNISGCASDCDGKECGDDGCGGSCGDCQALYGGNYYCDGNGQCVCDAQCDGRECGDDNCGGSCGECAPGGACLNGVCFDPPQGCDGVLFFADSNLEFAVRNAIGKPTGDLYYVDVAVLTSLTCESCGIASLDGIECVNRLISLDLYGNQISDIGPLAGLTDLQNIYLHNNQIDNLGPLVANLGIGEGDTVYLHNNRLNCLLQEDNIGQLQARGVNLYYDCCTPQCDGKLCGDDGCYGSCGECGQGEFCDYFSQCAGCPDYDLGTAVGDAVATGSTVGHGNNSYSGCGGWDEDVTFAWQAPDSGVYAFDLEGSSYSGLVYVWRDGCGGEEQGCTDGENKLFVQFDQGETAIVVVDGYQGNSGDYALNIHTCTPDCDGRECGDDGCGGSCGDCAVGEYCGDGTCQTCSEGDLGSAVGERVATGTTVGQGDDDYPYCAESWAPEVALIWTAPADGLYAFSTVGSDFNTVLSLKELACWGGEYDCDDNGGQNGDSYLTYTFGAGQQIRIHIDGHEDETGNFVLNIVADPENCQPDCEGKECGQDGCGGSCGGCDDQNACTADACDFETNSCQHEEVVCEDEDPCTRDLCDPTMGCAFPSLCDDGDPCTQDECNPATQYCSNLPMDCDDHVACTIDSCDRETIGCEHDAQACDSSCGQGAHEVEPAPLVRLDGSLAASANREAGSCVGAEGVDLVYYFTLESSKRLAAMLEKQWCGGMYLRAGDCATGEELLCGENSYETLDLEKTLAPGDYYLFLDSCEEEVDDAEYSLTLRFLDGLCGENACNDDNPCTDDHCDPATGECSWTNNNALCDDGDDCVVGSRCADGQCQGGEARDCNDGNPCTDDSCEPNGGCANAFNATLCPECGDESCDEQSETCADCPQDCGVCNDDCDNPTEIPAEGVQTIVGDFDLARHDYQPPCDPYGGATDLIYTFTLTERTGVRFDYNRSYAGVALAAGQCENSEPSVDGDGEPTDGDAPEESIYFFCEAGMWGDVLHASVVLEPGTYYLLVGGYFGPFTLTVTFTATCDTLTCDDGNPCTADFCDGQAGACDTVPEADGTTCDDDDSCTYDSECLGGTCGGGETVVCEDDGDPGTTEICDPSFGCRHVPSNDTCDNPLVIPTDGEYVAHGDLTDASRDRFWCDQNGNDVVYTFTLDETKGFSAWLATDDSWAGLELVKANSEASPDDNEDYPDGDAPNDCMNAPSIICAGNENWAELSGSLEAGTYYLWAFGDAPYTLYAAFTDPCNVLDCDDDNSCTQDLCNPESVECEHVPTREGLTCDDFNSCTENTTCFDGVCQGGEPVECLADENIFTEAACRPDSGCIQVPVNDTCETAIEVPPEGTQTYSLPLSYASDDFQPACSWGGLPDVVFSFTLTEATSLHYSVEGYYQGWKIVSGSCDEMDSDGDADGDGDAPDNVLGCNAAYDSVEGTYDLPAGRYYGIADAWNSEETAFLFTFSNICDSISCDDENPCTVDDCNRQTGECEYDTTTRNGESCEDGVFCTIDDECLNGDCVGGRANNCTDALVEPQCQTAWCDLQEDECVVEAAREELSCEDGLHCTVDDACHQGVCEPGGARDCSATPLSVPACQQAVCNETADRCEAAAANNGGACDDGAWCSVSDHCSNGACLGQTRNCSGAVTNPQCQSPVCNEAADRCEAAVANSGSACDDGQFCTANETCQGGSCQGGTARDCASALTEPQCQSANCNEVADRCETTAANNGSTCNDGKFCTVNEICQSGQCGGGAARDCSAAVTTPACQSASCNENVDRCETLAANNNQACDDGQFCTVGEVCRSGACQRGTARDCSAAVTEPQCQTPQCDEADDACEAASANEGGGCDDGQFCTVGEVCHSGACQGAERDCSAAMTELQCQTPQCDEDGKTCTSQAARQGETCDDHAFCTVGEICQNGSCSGGAPRDCDDRVPCTTDACDDSNAVCSHSANDLECSDNIYCNGPEACAPDDAAADGNGCIAGTAMVCDDGVACTDDSCDEQNLACANPPNAARCQDDLFCNGEENCDPSSEAAGADGCVAGTPPALDDAVACTTDGCDESRKIIAHEPDDAACTANNACLIGRCDPTEGCLTDTLPNGSSCETDNSEAGRCFDGECRLAADGEFCEQPYAIGDINEIHLSFAGAYESFVFEPPCVEQLFSGPELYIRIEGSTPPLRLFVQPEEGMDVAVVWLDGCGTLICLAASDQGQAGVMEFLEIYPEDERAASDLLFAVTAFAEETSGAVTLWAEPIIEPDGDADEEVSDDEADDDDFDAEEEASLDGDEDAEAEADDDSADQDESAVDGDPEIEASDVADDEPEQPIGDGDEDMTEENVDGDADEAASIEGADTSSCRASANSLSLTLLSVLLLGLALRRRRREE